MQKPRKGMADNESGFALLLAVFVISLATLIVMDTLYTSRFDQRVQRSFVESTQADYALSSALNFARVLIELPKQDGVTEDWLGEPWSLIAGAPSLPISGLAAEPKILIVDDSGRIDLNSVVGSFGQINPFDNRNENEATGTLTAEGFWINTLRELFFLKGFQQEPIPEEGPSIPGDVSLTASNQVAALVDWIDRDTSSFQSPSFDGRGIESDIDKKWFYNRPINNVSELLLVPGMTPSRFARIAPLVRVSKPGVNSALRVNINTAPIEVLVALGMPEGQVTELVAQRLNLPITEDILQTLTAGDIQLQQKLSTRSNQFTVYARVIMPNVTRWLKATVVAEGSVNRRKTKVLSVEYF